MDKEHSPRGETENSLQVGSLGKFKTPSISAGTQAPLKQAQSVSADQLTQPVLGWFLMLALHTHTVLAMV